MIRFYIGFEIGAILGVRVWYRGGWNHTLVSVYLVGRPDHHWEGEDKRLDFLARMGHGAEISDEDAYALVKSCLTPAQRAWLTRWEREVV
jgi:hypothetical protein